MTLTPTSNNNNAVSGLAASIRNAVDSETFDLAGQSPSTVEKAVQDAFSAPRQDLDRMIRVTLITGAGKLERQKYDESLAKTVTQTLRQLGYKEDRAASAVMACAGTFKLQHDTGKNLKTVVIFPLVAEAVTADRNKGGTGSSSKSSSFQLLEESTPMHRIVSSSMTVFQSMMESKCPTWSQKKECATRLEQIQSMLQEMDQQLLKGQPLSDEQQEFYDQVSANLLQQKVTWIREALQLHVEQGRLTTPERSLLLEQVQERIQSLTEEFEQAHQKQPPPAAIKKLENQLQKATERQQKIRASTPQPLPPLAKETEMAALRKELGPLLAMQEAAKGRLLTLKESQTLARKDEIMKELTHLENASRGWFESDEAFAARVEAARKAWEAKMKRAAAPAKAKAAVAPTSALPSSSSWATPKKGKGPAPAAKKTGAGRNTNSFAGMMNGDSDSD